MTLISKYYREIQFYKWKQFLVERHNCEKSVLQICDCWVLGLCCMDFLYWMWDIIPWGIVHRIQRSCLYIANDCQCKLRKTISSLESIPRISQHGCPKRPKKRSRQWIPTGCKTICVQQKCSCYLAFKSSVFVKMWQYSISTSSSK